MRKIEKERGSVYCNQGAWEAFNQALNDIQPSKVFVLTDTNTLRHCLPYFMEQWDYGTEPVVLEIPEGESHKTLDTCLQLWLELSNKGADRKSLLVNLGGGVVTDLGGFVASAFKRGIECINIPTSLLAMVDASVGGKNGVDLGSLKNQIGVIRDPLMVILDTKFLETLPEDHMASGVTEMLKHGLISSDAYWNAVQQFDSKKTDEAEVLIWDSVLIKDKVVTEDPFEHGLRKTLNYGHTLGHAIESYCLEHSTKRTLLHGEAVAIGLILETFISNKLLGFPSEKLNEINKAVLDRFEKIPFNDTDIQAIIELLIHDKKNQNGRVLFVLLEDIGIPQTQYEVSNDLIFRAFEYYENL